MIRTIFALCAGVSLVLGSADDTPTPTELLKSKGLRRSGDLFVLGAENDVQKAVNETRAASKAVTQIQERKKQFDQRLREGDETARQLMEQRIVLNQQLSVASNAAEHNRIAGMLNETNDRLNLLQRELNDPDASQGAAAQVAMKREIFIEKVLKLREVVDQALADYEKVAKDPEVTAALEAINKAGPKAVKLGPTKTLLNNVKNLENVEKAVLTETIPLRKEGGIYWLDVTFNGKVTKPMAFDTGASVVVLPFAMAREVGLTPRSGRTNGESQNRRRFDRRGEEGDRAHDAGREVRGEGRRMPRDAR